MLNATRFFLLRFLSSKKPSSSCTTRQLKNQRSLWLWSIKEYHNASLWLILKVVSPILLVAVSSIKVLSRTKVPKARSLISSSLLHLQLKVVFCQLTSLFRRMTQPLRRSTSSIWPLHFAISTSTGQVPSKFQLPASMLTRSLSSTWRSEPPRSVSKTPRDAANKLCKWGGNVRSPWCHSTRSFTSSEQAVI